MNDFDVVVWLEKQYDNARLLEAAKSIQGDIDTLLQPPPTGDGQVVLTKVLSDIQSRAEFGKIKYGAYLRTDNGRDALMDAYQEAIDLVMYLGQAIMERGSGQ